MTIFKEIVDEEFLTVSETKGLLADIEADRALDEERELPYELARAIDHVNQFTVLEPDDAQDLVTDLQEIEKVDEPTAYKIANLLPRNRSELRSVYAQQRYSLSGEELDDILNVVAKYA
ncbi:DNA-directed RNA polymerase subunit F [Natrialba magadii ATCC 43099]|uniref:DNA-directed RNA polymerase subunit Rpo4 n=1 Tax=Natrialba magadii (strain ATCC 43099 / DSM 3394 / CCM 3739 / CIP 104546 / IAM 13178 / JCM 8861 / NBRC 102185 / NCIMB 2190 / MS3) TaxID=547559 RepID=D3SRH6_NATMM|nr:MULTISPECIES: RNA polymerase Rpb4 family protein [Natrialba]ADD04681.1 DNA-directed RNA polymerase subunit F [Natrialba magadii ATCC 43099]ELY25337.1 DNA-directed RNA polymerase subunit F [Natrialba magadii ATCC 43099]OIB55871.1 DNA-directed RNA polymerase subunit F [Natrialba sp. SSL1]